jgi:hypothetical protein
MKLNNRLITLLQTLTVWSKLYSTDRSQIVKEWIEGFNSNLTHEGKRGTVIKYKGLHQCALRIALDLPIDKPLPFLKSSKEGVPRILNPLLPLLKGSRQERQFGLTLTNLYRLIKVSPDTDTTTITKGGRKVSSDFLQQFEK